MLATSAPHTLFHLPKLPPSSPSHISRVAITSVPAADDPLTLGTTDSTSATIGCWLFRAPHVETIPQITWQSAREQAMSESMATRPTKHCVGGNVGHSRLRPPHAPPNHTAGFYVEIAGR